MAALRSQTVRYRLLLAAFALACVLLVVLAPEFMLAMAPAIALFSMVAHRVMPGEELILRLRGSTAAPRRREPAPRRLYDVMVVRRAGRLIASALAMRPPPARPLLSN